MDKDPPKLYTTQQAADRLGITDGYLRTLVSKGKATPKQQIGGTLIFDEAEIERLSKRPYKRKKT